MRQIFIIAKVTILYSIRSYLFQFLFVLLLAGIVLLPLIVTGDGTLQGQFQISLIYTLWFIKTLLSCSIVWFSCYTFAEDIQTWKIHLIRTKPVPCHVLWIGKWLGILMIHGLLLLVASTIVYFLIFWRLDNLNFAKAELQRLKAEVLVGRRLAQPLVEDISQAVEDEYNERLIKGQISPNLNRKKLLKELSQLQKLRGSEVKPNSDKKWEYRRAGLATSSTPLQIRYRLYIDESSNRPQPETLGIWWVLNPEENQYYPYSQKSPSGIFQEFTISSEVIDKGQNFIIKYENRDPFSKSVVFQLDDGPFILSKVCEFWQNYLRAIVLLFLQFIFLATLGCTAGSILSLPMAIFISFSYIMLGVLVVMLRFTFPEQDEITNATVISKITAGVRGLTAYVTVPIQEFDAFYYLSRGECIEIKRILMVIFKVIFLRTLPLGFIGIWQLSQRELGLVSKS